MTGWLGQWTNDFGRSSASCRLVILGDFFIWSPSRFGLALQCAQDAATECGILAYRQRIREGTMERMAQCHCGSLRVIPLREPEREYCMSLQLVSAAPGLSSIPAALIRKAKFGSRATTRFRSVTRTAASRSAFISARIAAAPLRGTGCPNEQAATFFGRVTGTPTSTGSRWAPSPNRISRRQPTRHAAPP